MSEAAKVRELENVMKYVKGKVIDLGCGGDRIAPDAFGVDGRSFEGVGYVTDDPYDLESQIAWRFGKADVVFSSHFLEHLRDQWGAIVEWRKLLKETGYLILYLPDGRYYNNKENEEHMIDMNYDQFILWFRRSFCGEGKNFKGEYLPKLFDVVESGMDVGEDKYSFFVVARKV